MIIKYALRNIIRLPKQAFIYAIIAMLVTASIITGNSIYSATERAINQLNDEYIFVATLVPLTTINPDGTGDITSYMTYDDIGMCYNDKYCIAYNFSVANTKMSIAGEDALYDLPTGTVSDNPGETWSDTLGCNVEATSNLFLERQFFNDKARITEGRPFSKDAYYANTQEVIIPKSVADKNGITVGSKISVCWTKDKRLGPITYGMCEVVGIYESDNASYTPAYVTTAYLLFRTNITGSDIYRADYVLKNKFCFEDLVVYAKEQGLDFNRFELVLNNAVYDRIINGLVNVRNLVIISVSIITLVGTGLFIFFTSFFITARKRECFTLHLLGMRKFSIFCCFAVEMLSILLIVTPIGVFGGNILSDRLFEHVNNSSLADMRRVDTQATIYAQEQYLPLEKEIDILISKTVTEAYEKPELVIVNEKKDNYSRIINTNNLILYGFREDDTTIKTEPKAISVLAVENLEATDSFELSTPYEDDGTMIVYCYVPKNYVVSEGLIFLTYDVGTIMQVSFTPAVGPQFMDITNKSNIAFRIKGTYKPNELCSDDTVIISYEIFQKRFAGFTGYADGYIETVSNGN